MPHSSLPTDLEQLVLLAVLHAEDEAYGAAIQEQLAERANRNLTLGTLYVTLARMEGKGFVESALGDPTSVRGGKAKRLYRVTAEGERALAEARQTQERMWEGIRLSGARGSA